MRKENYKVENRLNLARIVWAWAEPDKMAGDVWPIQRIQNTAAAARVAYHHNDAYLRNIGDCAASDLPLDISSESFATWRALEIVLVAEIAGMPYPQQMGYSQPTVGLPLCATIPHGDYWCNRVIGVALGALYDVFVMTRRHGAPSVDPARTMSRPEKLRQAEWLQCLKYLRSVSSNYRDGAISIGETGFEFREANLTGAEALLELAESLMLRGTAGLYMQDCLLIRAAREYQRYAEMCSWDNRLYLPWLIAITAGSTKSAQERGYEGVRETLEKIHPELRKCST